MRTRTETFIVDLLKNVADVEVGGTRPWDIQVHDPRAFGRILTQGTLGLGESYMAGWWDCERIDELATKLHVSNIKARLPIDFGLWISVAKSVFLNLPRLRIFEVGEKHYDVGNPLYRAMLDLQPGQKILDIGSGWGGFLKFAAENYRVEGVGVTVSTQQYHLSQRLCADLPIEIKLCDYQSLNGRFDRIVSVGMFEHVGHRNYAAYIQKARDLLADDGLLLLHSIGGNVSVSHGDPWSEKYIFPNSMLPSMRQMAKAAETRFVVEDWHNFGADYDRTLMAWHANFERAWPQLKADYDTRFYRMWRYYLLSFAGTFRARNIQLWQVVYSPNGVPGGYISRR